MTPFITEMLQDLNDNPESVVKYKDNTIIKNIFEYTYNPVNKFVLPEGNPPYKEDAAPMGMSNGNLLMEVRKFYVFCRADLAPLKRESLFVQLLENINPAEAKLVLAIKDQDLTKLYKKLTHKFAFENSLVTVGPVVKQTKKQKVLAGVDL